MKIYLSGPIKNDPNHKEEFEKREIALKSEGHKVVNPLKLNHKEDATYEEYMEKDIEEMKKCDAVKAFNFHIVSVGRTREIEEAKKVGIPVFY